MVAWVNTRSSNNGQAVNGLMYIIKYPAISCAEVLVA